MSAPGTLWRGRMAAAERRCIVETPKVAPKRADTPNNWTGSGSTLAYGDEHEDR